MRATGVTWRCSAPGAPGRGICSRSPAWRVSSSVWSPGSLGSALGLAAVQLLVVAAHSSPSGEEPPPCSPAIGLAIAGSAAARLASTREALCAEVTEGRRATARARAPAWRRYYLDLLALALSGLIYWLTIRTGFSAVISPDSNPTLSLSVYMFFGPALLWIGATLLLLRLRGRFMGALAAVPRAGRKASRLPRRLEPRPPGDGASTAASS